MAPLMMSVADFADEVRDDFNAVGNNNFHKKLFACRQTINTLEEVKS